MMHQGHGKQRSGDIQHAPIQGSDGQRVAIKDIQLETKNRMVIGMVIKKGAVRQIADKKTNKNKLVFAFIIRDMNASIAVNCWDDAASLCDIIDVGQVVSIDGFYAKVKSEYSLGRVCTSPLELSLNSITSSSVIPYTGTDLQHFKFYASKPLNASILATKEGESANLLAAVAKILPPQTVTTREGKEVTKQSVALMDKTGQPVSLILWDKDLALVEKMQEETTVIFVSDAKIKCYNGTVQATFSFDSTIIFNPEIEAARSLRIWASDTQLSANYVDFQPGSSILTEGDFLDPNDYVPIREIIEMKNNTELSDVKGFTIASLTDVDLQSGTYMACASCNKKVEVSCFNPKCMQAEQSAGVIPRFKIPVDIIDHTAFLGRIMLFGEAAESFIGLTAAEFSELGPEGKEELRSSHVWHKHKVCFKMNPKSDKISIISCRRADMGEALMIAQSKIIPA